jgi:hypothetical protein
VLEVHGILKTVEADITSKTPQVLMVKFFGVKKPNTKKNYGYKGKGKVVLPKSTGTNTQGKKKAQPPLPPEESQCFECNQMGHQKRNCHVYLSKLKNTKNGEGSSSGVPIYFIYFSLFPLNHMS